MGCNEIKDNISLYLYQYRYVLRQSSVVSSVLLKVFKICNYYSLIIYTVKCVCSSSIYWTGPFPGIKSPIEACAFQGGVRSLKTVNIKQNYFKTLIKLFWGPLVI